MRPRTLVGFAAALLMAAPSAYAISISFTAPSTNPAAAQAAEAAFLASLVPGSVTESFEGIAIGTSPSYSTSVGTFAQTMAASPSLGNCWNLNNCQGLAVLDNAAAAAVPYSGRFATTGTKWLDSNDSTSMLFTLVPERGAVGFYVTDANDVSGFLRVTAFDGGFASIAFPAPLASGTYSYVTVYDPSGIASIAFDVVGASANDGFGIDDVTTGNAVPEPGTLLLLGAGLLGLGRRCRREQQ